MHTHLPTLDMNTCRNSYGRYIYSSAILSLYSTEDEVVKICSKFPILKCSLLMVNNNELIYSDYSIVNSGLYNEYVSLELGSGKECRCDG